MINSVANVTCLAIVRLWTICSSKVDTAVSPISTVGTFTVLNGGCTYFATLRSEERRVGKECRSRWGADQGKKKKEKIEVWDRERHEVEDEASEDGCTSRNYARE